jgi:hypothetical protein
MESESAAAIESCRECPRCRQLEQLVDDLRKQLETKTNRPNSNKWTASDEKPFLQEYFEHRKSDFEQSRGKCSITIARGSLVDADEKYKVHLVSADMKRSRGVAVAFAEAYGPVDMTQHIFKIGDIHEQVKNGSTLLNLVHKDKYFYKFGYDPNAFLSNIVDALASLKEYCVLNDIKRLALVRIASNTERVHWRWTQMKLLEIFSDLEITLAIYLHKPPKKFFHKTTSTPDGAPVVTDLRTGPLLEDAALRLADLETGEGNDLHKGSVGGGSLPMLPLPNRKPPRHPLPDKVKERNWKGTGKTNPSCSLSNNPRDEGRTIGRRNGRTSSCGQPAAEPRRDETRETLPKRLSGGGGQSTLPPPPREPPLTNTREKVISGGKGSSKANVLSPPRMSAENTNDLSEVVLLLRDEISKIRTDFADLRRSMTPGRPEAENFHIPVSPASSAFVSSRNRSTSIGQKNTQRRGSISAK